MDIATALGLIFGMVCVLMSIHGVTGGRGVY